MVENRKDYTNFNVNVKYELQQMNGRSNREFLDKLSKEEKTEYEAYKAGYIDGITETSEEIEEYD